MLSALQKQQQRSSDEGYSSPAQQGLPALPTNPLLQHHRGQENRGYDTDIEEYPRDLGMPGYPTVIQNRTPTMGTEEGDRPVRNQASPMYDENSIQNPPRYPPLSPSNVPYQEGPYPVNRNIERVKNAVDFDSDYESQTTSSQQQRRRKGSNAGLIESPVDLNYLRANKDYDTVSTSMLSMGELSRYLLCYLLGKRLIV